MVTEVLCLKFQIIILEHDRQEQVKEFAEVSRLMAIMQMRHPLRSFNSRVEDSSAKPGIENALTKQPLRSVDKVFQPSMSNADEPTVKRTKTHRSIKSPSTHRAKLLINNTSRKSDGTIKSNEIRSPLKELQDHALNLTPQFCELDQTQERGGEGTNMKRYQDYEDNENFSFEESDMGTSTDQHLSNENNSRSIGEIYDDAATDFEDQGHYLL